MAFTTFTKDPQAVLDYVVDWSAWLGDDTISASDFSAPEGITITSDSFDSATGKTTVWLSGGTPGKSYKVTNSISTDGGRDDDRTMLIKVEQK